MKKIGLVLLSVLLVGVLALNSGTITAKTVATPDILKVKWFQVVQEKACGETGTYVSNTWIPTTDIEIVGFNLYAYVSPEVSPTFVAGVADMQAIFSMVCPTSNITSMVGFIQGTKMFWQQKSNLGTIQNIGDDIQLFKEQEIMFPSNCYLDIPAGTTLTVTSYGRQCLAPYVKYYFLAAVMIYYVER